MNNYKIFGPGGQIPVGVVSLNVETVEELEKMLGGFELAYMWNRTPDKLMSFQIVIKPVVPGEFARDHRRRMFWANQNDEKWTDLIGKKVIVTLKHPEETGEDSVVAKGILVAFDEGGEARIQQEDGFLAYCWPMLDVKEDVE